MTQQPHLFFSTLGLDHRATTHTLQHTLHGFDDGELFLEYRLSEAYVLDDGVVKTSSSAVSQGFGLRAIAGEQTGYTHASDLSEEAIKRASATLKGFNGATSSTLALAPASHTKRYYTQNNPLAGFTVAQKILLLQTIDAYCRDLDARVTQVTAALQGSWQNVCILHSDGSFHDDVRPMVYLSLTVTTRNAGGQEQARDTMGGRMTYDTLFDATRWKTMCDKTVQRAINNLSAKPAPAGDMPVVLGHGGPAVLLHEAVGHGFEGDFNRKNASVFTNMVGKQVASKGVTVYDGGDVEGAPTPHGTLSIDDEGTPTRSTLLIDDGIMVGHMQDRMNGRLMGKSSTGNGKRQSYAHAPIPRMTNTFMQAGNHALEDMIAAVDRGIYAVEFNGGQVDIVSGRFVFSTAEAYLIEGGKITAPIKGATLIGNGPEVMQKIQMIGNDFAFDHKIGVCGKAGQGVMVGMGQPSMLISSMTVGGTTT